MKIEHKLFESIQGKKRELDKLRPFPKAALHRLRDQFIVEWTFNSNAIEGNTLTLRETELVLNHGLTISGKPLREHFEATNHKKAIIELEGFISKKVKFSEELIKSIHKIILENINDDDAGQYRKEKVRILGAAHIPPDPVKLPRLMDSLVSTYFANEKRQDAVSLAAQIHYDLVKIHPFIDGNGRTARLMMNLVLMENGYPPAVILKTDRRRYYRVLKEFDVGRPEGFINFIAKAVERSLIIYLDSLEPSDKETSAKQGYISLAEAAEHCDYSQEYLSLLARRGKLSAVKFNRNWMTTISAIEEYLREIKHGTQ